MHGQSDGICNQCSRALTPIEILTQDRDEWKKRALKAERDDAVSRTQIAMLEVLIPGPRGEDDLSREKVCALVGKAATLEAEVRRLTGEPCVACGWNGDETATEMERLEAYLENAIRDRDTARAQLAMLSRCALALVEALPKCDYITGSQSKGMYTCGEIATRRDYHHHACEEHRFAPNGEVYGEERYAVPLRALLAALDSGGGEGET